MIHGQMQNHSRNPAILHQPKLTTGKQDLLLKLLLSVFLDQENKQTIKTSVCVCVEAFPVERGLSGADS